MRGVSAAFAAAPQLILREVARAAKEGLTDMQRDARQEHSFTSRSSNLNRAVKVDFNNFEGRGLFIDSGVAPYGLFVHDGTKPHVIRPKNGKYLRWAGTTRGGNKSKTNFIFAKEVHHPGTKPDQFIYQAAERGLPGLVNRINQAIGTAIIKLGMKGKA
jgi:hypothetical protein